ncbi:MAG: dihydropteroate synthase [Marinovum sp.]|nr:dihydropteroate synthase [Marinovum sp.]
MISTSQPQSRFRPYPRYFRPLVQYGPMLPSGAVPLAGGPGWFTHVEVISRTEPSRIAAADAVPSRMLTCLSAPRAPIAGIMMDEPRVMGILNVTPDSFSDGGDHNKAASASAHGVAMVEAGADIIDVGGESTRPCALEVPMEAEIARVEPAIASLSPRTKAVISIDTRKTAVAEVAVSAGAGIVNDVSGFTFDPTLARFCAHQHLAVCIMHSPDTPDKMQDQTDYAHLLLDIYDFLGHRIAQLEDVGIPKARMIIDPGIGFGKTATQNLAILRNLSIFHGHGVPLLVGASRKGFIRRYGGAEDPKSRMAGSLSVGIGAVAQGAQILRVHDVAETKQAVKLWSAVHQGVADDT